MNQIIGYSITKEIYSSFLTLVYRAERTSDRHPVVIKLPRHSYPSFSELAQYRNAYSIGNNLNLPGVIKMLGLEQVKQRLALVMEDFGGVSLNQEIDRWGKSIGSSSEEITAFFQIALQLAKSLAGLHQHRIIHKDIKPQNIIIHPETRQVQIIDFSNATQLPKETLKIPNPHTLEGTLAYMSPEQTGRMNRGIDYRSDFYSLGVTFYQLLTGKLPFNAEDPLEIIHCHIARQPVAPMEVNPTLPEMLNSIVLKLMAKIPEQRYHSAMGLYYDLEKCQFLWDEENKITWFKLGEKDNSDRFIIPEKLYGRKPEVQTLLAAFERISRQQTKPQAELILVAGFPGIGKSALVNEVHKPIVEKRGYFISGKFEQYQKDIPFSGWVKAFRDLMKQVLSEPQSKVESFVAKLKKALGQEGQVVIDVVPELELLIGKQLPATELSPTAAQNRFNLLFQKFISVFAQADHPLVIFLDDLHWADLASIRLIKLLLEQVQIHHLLLIGAYRDNQVNPSHALILTVEEMKKSEAVIHQINLAPLTELALNHLISDTLNFTEQKSWLLTQQVYRKTQGNPFFSNQFFQCLYKEELIFYNSQKNKWEYQLEKIKVTAEKGDVVELVATQLQKLPEPTQKVLQLAACIGNQFDLATLAIVWDGSPIETASALWSALQGEFIVPKDEMYKFYASENNILLEQDRQQIQPKLIYRFLHDRVQQAAYSLIPAAKKEEIHLKIGRMLLQNASEIQQEAKVFDIVNQLNQARKLISAKVEQNQLAKLNLIAGNKAKASTAYNAAMKYFQVGLKLLPGDSWETEYDLTLALYTSATEAAYLQGKFEQMEELSETVIQNATTVLDRVKIYEIRVLAYNIQNQAIEAVKIAIPVLQELGIQLPTQPTAANLEQEFATVGAMLEQKSIEEIANQPLMNEPYPKAAIRLLASLAASTYISFPQLYPFVIFEQIKLSLSFGNDLISPYSYCNYGLIFGLMQKDFKTGYQFGKLAVDLISQLNTKEYKATVYAVFYGHSAHWQKTPKESMKGLLAGYASGLEVGDWEFAGYCLGHYATSAMASGKNLNLLETELANYSEVIGRIKQEVARTWINIYWQTILNLVGKTENPTTLVGLAYDEQHSLCRPQLEKNRLGMAFLQANKLMLFYLFGEYDQALEITNTEKKLDGGTGPFNYILFYFYDSLARLATASQQNNSQQNNLWERVGANQSAMEVLAKEAPGNYLHKYYLVEAECHRVKGEKTEAIEAYDQAIALATKNEYIQDVALANELCGKFYLDWGKTKVAQTYMLEAYYSYGNWGAISKVKDLEKRYRELLDPVMVYHTGSIHPWTSTRSNSAYSTTASRNSQNILDVNTVIKASQTLSGEIKLDDLLSTLISLVMENAGAQKCALILLKNDELMLEAIANFRELTIADNQKYAPNIKRPRIPVGVSPDLPQTLINYVWRTQESLMFNDASCEANWANDNYINQQQPKSLLCTPITKQDKLIGIFYLENNLAEATFTPERLQLLEMIGAQAAISLENALLYDRLVLAKAELEVANHTLEEKVQKRTKELNEKNQYLAQTLQELKHTQSQLIQTEKMSSLGQLVAGVAHEINNPVSFIHGNLIYAQDYAQNLLDVIDVYQESYTDPVPSVKEIVEEVELDFLIEDFPKLLKSMKMGANRIQKIVESLRNFSRLDEAEVKPVDIHEGIDSTLMILDNRLKTNSDAPEILVVKNYSKLPKIECYAGQLNQVFMNIISNAIDALELDINNSKDSPKITITTKLKSDKIVLISIADNGCGMSESVQKQIFDPFYTTKPVGKGTGLGLAISYQVVVKYHGGQLNCISIPGEGTEFIIEIPCHLSSTVWAN
ncbi:MAG: AAA family ATPase [Microcoleaceae cyanobacterium]